MCNLAAVNLAMFANKETKTVDFESLRETVKVGVRMQDNVIDATPYLLEENKQQALGERRVGLGVMGLADLLIYCEKSLRFLRMSPMLFFRLRKGRTIHA